MSVTIESLNGSYKVSMELVESSRMLLSLLDRKKKVVKLALTNEVVALLLNQLTIPSMRNYVQEEYRQLVDDFLKPPETGVELSDVEPVVLPENAPDHSRPQLQLFVALRQIMGDKRLQLVTREGVSCLEAKIKGEWKAVAATAEEAMTLLPQLEELIPALEWFAKWSWAGYDPIRAFLFEGYRYRYWDDLISKPRRRGLVKKMIWRGLVAFTSTAVLVLL